MEFVRTLKQVQTSEPDMYGVRACDVALLANERVATPTSFVLTTKAWDLFIKKNNIQYKLDFILKQIDVTNERTINSAYNSIRRLLIGQPFPDEILQELKEAYESLGGSFGLDEMMKEDNSPFVMMLASPNYPCEAESFEGIIQNVRGIEQIILALKEIYAMNYTADAISYRRRIGVKDFHCAVLIQSMPRSVASATAYSTDPEHQDLIFVHAYKGFTDLRDIVAKDFFHVKKEFLNVSSSQIVEQTKIIVRNEDGHLGAQEFTGRDQSLNDKEIMEVGRLAKKVEKAFESPVKLFVAITEQNEFFVLFANRYAVPQRKAAVFSQETEEKAQPAFKQDPKTGATVALGAAAQTTTAQATPQEVVETHDKYDSEDDDIEDVQEYYEEPAQEPVQESQELNTQEQEDPLTIEDEEFDDDLLVAADDEEFDEETQEFADEPEEESDNQENDLFEEKSEPQEEYEDLQDEHPSEDLEQENESFEYEDEPEYEDLDEDSQGDEAPEKTNYADDIDQQDDEELEYEDDQEAQEDDAESDEDNHTEDDQEYEEDLDEQEETNFEDESEDEAQQEEPEEQLDDQEALKDMLNKSFRIIYAELAKEYEKGGDQAPDTITELVSQGVQKQLFHIDGLSELLAIKRKMRTDDPITEEEKALVLRIVNELVE